MFSTVYSFRNKRVVLFQKPMFYLVKNKDQLEKVIDSLLHIDAVSSPCSINFPCVLKLLNNEFAPTLVLSSKKEYLKELKNHNKLLKNSYRALNEK